MAMTITETLRTGWRDINSAKRLRGAILHAARRLRELGRADIAELWESRVRAMPRQRMDKEAINAVLLMACRELDACGIGD